MYARTMASDITTLSIYHNIHLTKEQRYALHNGDLVETVGVSVPIWSKGILTSEPAHEIFCRYRLSNPEGEIPIKICDDGYNICIPRKEVNRRVPELDDYTWRNLSDEDLADYYAQRGEPVSSVNLLDIQDGGSASLTYRERNRLPQSAVEVHHYVNIADVSQLLESIHTG
jgi:hypothetical protein